MESLSHRGPGSFRNRLPLRCHADLHCTHAGHQSPLQLLNPNERLREKTFSNSGLVAVPAIYPSTASSTRSKSRSQAFPETLICDMRQQTNGLVRSILRSRAPAARNMAAAPNRLMLGAALQRVDSLGDVLGDFVVMAITETRRDIRATGLPLRTQFQVTLRSAEVNRQCPGGSLASGRGLFGPFVQIYPSSRPHQLPIYGSLCPSIFTK